MTTTEAFLLGAILVALILGYPAWRVSVALEVERRKTRRLARALYVERAVSRAKVAGRDNVVPLRARGVSR